MWTWVFCNTFILLYLQETFSIFNKPFSECFCFDDKKKIKVYFSNFLQFLIVQLVVLQADNSSCYNESQKNKHQPPPNKLIMKEIPTLY